LPPLQQSLLQEDSRIELVRQTFSINIVAPKAVAEAALLGISNVLRTIRTDSIDISNITADKVSDETLRTLSSITRTQVVYSHTGRGRLEVTSLTPKSPDNASVNLETEADVVYRLLLAASAEHEDSLPPAVVQPADARNCYLVLTENISTLSWDTRLKSWGRWLAPRSALPGRRPMESTTSLTTLILKHPITAQSSTALGIADVGADLLSGATQNQRWSANQLSTRAVFGHILHPFPGNDSPQPLSRPPLGGKRAFVPIAPPLSSLAIPAQVPDRPVTSGTIGFLPDPSGAHLRDGGALPELILSLDFLEDGSHEVTRLRAITSRDVIDVLQPAHAVDVRITQQSYFELTGQHAIQEHATPIMDFIHKSQLSLLHGRFATPALVPAVRMPRSLVAMRPDAVPQQSGPAPTSERVHGEASDRSVAAGEDDHLFVDYIFAGVDLHHTATTGYDGWQLRYSITEEGTSKCRRSELSLESTMVEMKDHEVRGGHSYDSMHFMATVSELAQAPKFWGM
jgi:hypothetical protein